MCPIVHVPITPVPHLDLHIVMPMCPIAHGTGVMGTWAMGDEASGQWGTWVLGHNIAEI